ncbi:MAG: pyruvate dehydrogenase kinase [Candidatus Sumerlaeia bacterium]|nr:pyruvate dehydrogenase kinase [Candidatus Sumerlaeia bacterium]
MADAQTLTTARSPLEHPPQLCEDELLGLIAEYARRPYTTVSVNQLFAFQWDKRPVDAKLLSVAEFLRGELPVRLAHMAEMLAHMPGGLAQTAAAQLVRGLYLRSFADVYTFPKLRGEEDCLKFIELVERIKMRHSRVVETMAKGILDLKEKVGDSIHDLNIAPALDAYYTTRIGTRVLIGHHAALRRHRPGWVGIICGQTSPATSAREAYHLATEVCRRYYSVAPKLTLLGHTELTFKYIPSHLRHIFFELFKNSMRATIETHGAKGTLPDIKVVIADGSEDVAIKISDEGGGIARTGLSKIWSYTYTTAMRPPESPYQDDFGAMAGYGHGLPLSRLYVRYFGGELQILSMHGYGTDAYMHLNKLGTNREMLV